MKHTFYRGKNGPVVRTTKGLVKGYCYDGLTVFKGIPYAKAKRFHAPEPMEPWEGIFDAGSYGMVCPLLQNDRPTGELLIPHRFWPMDENCQNLNIWTPGIGDQKCPVLVWLHGGGFSAGSSIEQVAYDGANMSRMGNVVVVSINHRLNILGYLDLSEYGEEYANSGNAGGDDIIAALSWIHDNILFFGGDPDNVTVFGQSGGGGKITALLQSPAADGLYQKGVIMSGILDRLLMDTGSSAKPLIEALCRELGLTCVQELETVDYHALAVAYGKVSTPLAKQGQYVGCVPRKNDSYWGDPAKYGFREETENIPLMVGSVFGEFASFVGTPCDRDAMTRHEQIAFVRRTIGSPLADKLLGLFADAYPQRQPVDLLHMDFLFRLPGITYIAQRSKRNHCTWSYLFNMDQPIDGGSTPWHCSDIPYFFHNLDLVEYAHGETKPEGLAEKVEKLMFDSLMAFARTGNPQTPELPLWPASADGTENTLVLDAEPRVLENFDHELISEAARAMAETFAIAMQKQRESLQN